LHLNDAEEPTFEPADYKLATTFQGNRTLGRTTIMQSTPSPRLSGSVAVVTGGSRGIGVGIATVLADLGASVVVTGRDKARVGVAARELSSHGPACEGVVCDVSDIASVTTLGTWLRQNYGHVDILVNNAGIGGTTSLLHELDPGEWNAIFDTNVRGVFYTLRAVVPMMIAAGTGHIINISSLAGKNPLPRGAAYSASKWALNGLTYSVAEELRSYNIRVSLVCPGSVDTDFSPHLGKDPDRMLKPEDVGHVVAMLVTQRPQSFVSEVLLRPTQKP
jgi:3-oxoacyl-[acyl-carrier protein] reductase